MVDTHIEPISGMVVGCGRLAMLSPYAKMLLHAELKNTVRTIDDQTTNQKPMIQNAPNQNSPSVSTSIIVFAISFIILSPVLRGDVDSVIRLAWFVKENV